MSTNEMITKIEALNEWERLIEEAKAEANAIRDSIKAEMDKQELEELEVGAYIVRWTSVLSNRFDTTGFKKLTLIYIRNLQSKYQAEDSQFLTNNKCSISHTGLWSRKDFIMVYGYARCSTNEDKQDIKRQVRELKKAGAEQIFLEYEHGDSKVKQELSSLLEQAKEGDTIITLEVSRLARSTKQLCDIIDIVRTKRLQLNIVGSITVDCSSGDIDPMTNAFIQMSGVFAELELRIIRERVRSGMANAKAKGVKIGRPKTTTDTIPSVFYRHYPSFKTGQLNLSEFARVCNLSRVTIYKYLELIE